MQMVMNNMAHTELDDAVIAAFATSLRGELIRPSDANYDEARAVWNGMIDKRPALIAQVAGVADVITAVNFARENNVLVSIRGGGHNVAGSALNDGGLVIDMSQMKGIYVNPVNGRVRAEAGVLLGELDHETQAFGLAVPSGVVTETGIAGLTLGGGYGWLRGKYGLTIDNLISADMVTADGRFVTASAQENADLFWGLRGGGGNFGVVTAFEFQAHEIGTDVNFAFIIHPEESMRAALQLYREFTRTSPDEISTFGIIGNVPALPEIDERFHGKPGVIFLACHIGTPQQAANDLRDMLDWGQPIFHLFDTMPFVEVQQFFDEDYPSGEMHYYWKSAYLNELTDDAIDTLITVFKDNPSPHSTIDLWHQGGAVSRVAATTTAFGDRSARFMIGAESNWEIGEDDDANINWNRSLIAAMKRFTTDQEYLNFPGFYEGGEAAMRASFGDNYDRLVDLKTKYDPTNMFSQNQNIKPRQS